MKKYVIAVIFVLCSLSRVFTQDMDINTEPVFKAGEELSYKLKYGIFTAAEAHLRVEESDIKFDGKPAYHIIADGKTAGSFDIFYKVRNRYETYVDKTTLMPYLYTENRHEGDWKHTDKVTFDHDEKKITATKGTFSFKGRVFDFPSAYYFARGLDVSKMKVGDKFTLQYFLDDGVQNLSITYVGKEQVKSSMGKFNCLKFNPTIIPGKIFRKDSKLYLWITDDNNRIPVKAKVEVVVGSLTMDLTNAKNLKFPLNAIK